MAKKSSSPTGNQFPDLTRLSVATTEHSPMPMATVEGSSRLVRYANPAFCRLVERPLDRLIGKALTEFLPEKNEWGTSLDRVILTRKPENFTCKERSQSRDLFWSYTIWPVVGDENLLGVMIQIVETNRDHQTTVAMNEALVLSSLRQHELTEEADQLNGQLRVEIAERKESEASLFKRASLLRVISEASAHLLTADSPRLLLDIIFGDLARVLEAEIYLGYLFSGDHSSLRLEIASALTAEQRAQFAELPLDPASLANSDNSAEPFATDLSAACVAHEAIIARTFNASAVTCLLIKVGNRILGTFSVASATRALFDGEERRFVQTLCDLVAAGLERARLSRVVIRAKDIAEQANVAKDNFLAALSHELRTPLTPVLLVAGEGNSDPMMPPATRAMFASIVKNAKLEARLIDDLLDITRITHGKITLDRQVVDLHEIIRDAVETVRSELEEKQIVLTQNLAAKNSKILGDYVRLQQICWNVLRNAVKFSPLGGEIIVTTANLAEESVRIMVIDSGIGISPKELARLFTSFSQGDHANPGGTHRFGGLGLGLSISRMLAELHSGSIWAESLGLNKGATFFIELPLAKIEAPTPLLSPTFPKAAITVETVLDKTQTSGRVLLVEDHGSTRKALEHLLVRRHFEVVPVGSLAAARSAAERERFDLLISDIGLPDGTGHDLMKELHSRFGLKGIALTGYGMDDDLSRSREAGFITHLTKPVSIEALEQALAVATSQQ